MISLDAPMIELVGIVMKNSGGSADPLSVEKVIRALRGERVSMAPLPPLKRDSSDGSRYQKDERNDG